MILVTGAAGKTGNAMVRAVASRGEAVRALVRRPEQGVALKALGAIEVSVGDFEDLPSLARATADVRAIYHICPNVSGDEMRFASAIAAAAATNGVRRFVYHSVLHPQIEAMPHHWQKMRVEEMLFAKGFDLTILQPTAYMQNLLGAWRRIAEEGAYRIPYPAETYLSLIDLDDLAEAAARVLTDGGHIGATYELAGTMPLSQNEVAATIGAALGRTIRVEVEAVDTWEARAQERGVGDRERATLVAMFRYYAAHGLVGNPNTLQWLLGRVPNDLASFVARYCGN